jgi:hypothetical protein
VLGVILLRSLLGVVGHLEVGAGAKRVLLDRWMKRRGLTITASASDNC